MRLRWCRADAGEYIGRMPVSGRSEKGHRRAEKYRVHPDELEAKCSPGGHVTPARYGGSNACPPTSHFR